MLIAGETSGSFSDIRSLRAVSGNSAENSEGFRGALNEGKGACKKLAKR
jgi:hypothetical protein